MTSTLRDYRVAPVRQFQALVEPGPEDTPWSALRGLLWLGVPALLAEAEVQPVGLAVGHDMTFEQFISPETGRRRLYGRLWVTSRDVPASFARRIDPTSAHGAIAYYPDED